MVSDPVMLWVVACAGTFATEIVYCGSQPDPNGTDHGE
jgi:hypothetical protein